MRSNWKGGGGGGEWVCSLDMVLLLKTKPAENLLLSSENNRPSPVEAEVQVVFRIWLPSSVNDSISPTIDGKSRAISMAGRASLQVPSSVQRLGTSYGQTRG